MTADFVRLAEQHAAAGRWPEVAALLEPVIETTESAGLWNMLAMARLNTGRRGAAADALLQAAQLDAEGGRAWLNAAAVLDQEGRVAQALDAAQRAVGSGFAPAEAHYLLGRSLQGLGRFTEAEQSCVVYGMPRSVVEAGLSDTTASLESMFDVILEKL